MKMSRIDTKNDKNLEIFEFPEILCSFFSKISIDFIDWNNMKRLNNEKMCCPVDFLEELITVVQVTTSQIDTEIDKNPKIFQFSKFLRNFC